MVLSLMRSAGPGPAASASTALRAGEVLPLPAATAGGVLVIRRGWVARCHELEDGRRQISALFMAGDLCDPLWPAGGAGTRAVALTPVETMMVALPPVPELLDEVAARARLSASWTVNLGRKSALERLANLFCELFVRAPRGDPRAGACEMPLSARDLADATGLTVQHVQRIVADLRTAGLARVARRRLTIPDFARLARTARFDPAAMPRRRNWLVHPASA